jgi:hypothetical protein
MTFFSEILTILMRSRPPVFPAIPKGGAEVLGNAHWNWERAAYIEGRGVTYLGKKNLINNFCTGIASNEGTCNRCHIGYGWKDDTFDFSNQNNIDCLICHDNTGIYDKARGGAGYPVPGLDFQTIVQNVGTPHERKLRLLPFSQCRRKRC